MNIYIASSDEIDQYDTEVDAILTILLGHAKALVTDSSSLFDFHLDPNMFVDPTQKLNVELEQSVQREALSAMTGLTLTEDDNPKIVYLAKRFRKMKLNMAYGPLANTTDLSVLKAGAALTSAQHNDEV